MNDVIQSTTYSLKGSIWLLCGQQITRGGSGGWGVQMWEPGTREVSRENREISKFTLGFEFLIALVCPLSVTRQVTELLWALSVCERWGNKRVGIVLLLHATERCCVIAATSLQRVLEPAYLCTSALAATQPIPSICQACEFTAGSWDHGEVMTFFPLRGLAQGREEAVYFQAAPLARLSSML